VVSAAPAGNVVRPSANIAAVLNNAIFADVIAFSPSWGGNQARFAVLKSAYRAAQQRANSCGWVPGILREKAAVHSDKQPSERR
jgi:hypothetical protein